MKKLSCDRLTLFGLRLGGKPGHVYSVYDPEGNVGMLYLDPKRDTIEVLRANNVGKDIEKLMNSRRYEIEVCTCEMYKITIKDQKSLRKSHNLWDRFMNWLHE